MELMKIGFASVAASSAPRLSALGKEIGVQGVGFSPDGNSLWAFSRNGNLKFWRAATPKEIAAAGKADEP